MRNFPRLLSAVQRNCDISDARHAGDYGLCSFLLKLREYYRWENELPFGRTLPRDDLGDWMTLREQLWDGIEADDFAPLPMSRSECDPFDADAANRELLPQGYVYSAGYGRMQKPVFFLGRLLRVEARAGFTVLVSSCEYARELAAPPAMTLGRTILLRQESVRRYLWEKIEEWQWRKQDNAMARALESYRYTPGSEAALQRMADNEIETMVLHEVGEAMAGEMLGEAWPEMVASIARDRSEPVVRAVRDLLADCLSTLPGLLERANLPALHFYFATFDAPRRQLFPQLVPAYEDFLEHGTPDRLWQAVRDGSERWQAVARALLSSQPAARETAIEALLGDAPAGAGRGASRVLGN